MEDLVTIVIPVYNVENYLNRCLSSIVNQSYHNLEILLIDDGSTDSSGAICDEWAMRDGRITVIHKDNEGAGAARNTGIEKASGEYICFFDSDDYIEPDTIECVYTRTKQEAADVTMYGFILLNSAGEKVGDVIPCPDKEVYIGEEVCGEFLPKLVGKDPETGKTINLWMSACACFFSMELFRRSGWRFASEREIISEDSYFLLGLFSNVNKVAVMSRAFYYYCENQTSFSRSYRPDRFEKIKHFYRKCIQLCEERGYSREVSRRCAELLLSFVIAAMKQEVAYHTNKADAIARIRMFVNDETLQKVLWEKKNDKTGFQHRVLFWAIRYKKYWLCYLLLKAKIRK